MRMARNKTKTQKQKQKKTLHIIWAVDVPQSFKVNRHNSMPSLAFLLVTSTSRTKAFEIFEKSPSGVNTVTTKIRVLIFLLIFDKSMLICSSSSPPIHVRQDIA